LLRPSENSGRWGNGTKQMLHLWNAIKLGLRAKKAGLCLSVDRSGRCYLSLSLQEQDRRGRECREQPEMCDTNSYLVLCAVTLDEVRDYLDQHTGPHRILGPDEAFWKGAPDDES
jgi:hypothetical protein